MPAKIKMKKSKINLRSKYTLLTALVCGVLLAAGGVAWAMYKQDTSQQDPGADVNRPTISGKSNLDPPTNEEQQEAEQHKEEIVKQQNNTNSNQSDQKKQVSVVITSANSSGVNAYVSGVIEDGGTCTAEFTQGSQKTNSQSGGFSNATTTNCELIITPKQPGEWQVKVNYESTRASGVSQIASLRVQ